MEGNAEEVGPFGFFCLDPRFSVIDEENCKVENRGWIGDGGCDAEGGYNTEECKYFFIFDSTVTNSCIGDFNWSHTEHFADYYSYFIPFARYVTLRWMGHGRLL